MKHFLIILVSLISFTANSQSKELIVVIQNIESIDCDIPDSIKIELGGPNGIMSYSESTMCSIIRTDSSSYICQKFTVKQEFTCLRVYFNQNGYVEIENILELTIDTLSFSTFKIYPECNQTGIVTEYQVYENDENGKIDYLNYKTTTTSEFELKNETCLVPDSISLKINGLSYDRKVIISQMPYATITGHGITKKKLFGKKKKFHYTKHEQFLVRKIKIKIKNGA